MNFTVRFKNPWFWVGIFGVVFTAFVEGRFSCFAFAEPFLRRPFEKFRVC